MSAAESPLHTLQRVPVGVLSFKELPPGSRETSRAVFNPIAWLLSGHQDCSSPARLTGRPSFPTQDLSRSPVVPKMPYIFLCLLCFVTGCLFCVFVPRRVLCVRVRVRVRFYHRTDPPPPPADSLIPPTSQPSAFPCRPCLCLCPMLSSLFVPC